MDGTVSTSYHLESRAPRNTSKGEWERFSIIFQVYTVLNKIQAAGITLNKEKCQFSCPRITFLGHIIDVDGISPDPSKTESIRKMKAPTTVTELRRFMGMINQHNKFSPLIAQLNRSENC